MGSGIVDTRTPIILLVRTRHSKRTFRRPVPTFWTTEEVMKTTTQALVFSAALVGGILIGGCAEQPEKAESESAPASVATGSAAEYENAITAAKAAQKKAASVGGEWRDVGKMIKDASKAAEAGDYAKATELADLARKHSELGYEQMMAQQKIENPDYLK